MNSAAEAFFNMSTTKNHFSLTRVTPMKGRRGKNQISMKAKLLVTGLVAGLWCSASLRADTPINAYLALTNNSVQVLWLATPSNVYVLKTTTNLAQPWQVASGQPPTLTATSNRLAVTLPVNAAARFFTVVRLDRQGPEVYGMSPTDNAIAVSPKAPVQAWLRDETGVNTNTISVAIGTNPPVHLSDRRLTWSNGQLTYAPATNEVLGALGDTVSVKISAADTLGNLTTNFTWSFQLALPTVVNSNLVFVGTSLTLISTNGDTFTYGYSGSASGLAVGMQIVDPNRSNGYMRTVLSFTNNPAAKTVVVATRIATLAELLQRGTLDSDTFTEVTPAGQVVKNDLSAGIGLNYSLPLDKVWYQDAYVTIGTLPSSHLNLSANLKVAANFNWFRLTEFEATLTGTADFELDAHAIASLSGDYSREIALITPIHRPFFGVIGGVPVWVDVVFEINGGYTAHWDASAEMTAGIHGNKAIVMGQHWDGTKGWLPISQNPDATCAFVGPTWQIQGNGNLRVYLQPKVTLLVYSVAGVFATLEPYYNLTGHVQANPYQWDMELYDGLDSTLGLNLSVWDKTWGQQPSTTFNLVPQTLLWQTNYPGDVPVILSQPQDQQVTGGSTAVFAVQAKGGVPMSYRWQRDGLYLTDDGRISGSQSSTLSIGNVMNSDAGGYSVVIANQWGSTNSRSAALTVAPPGPPQMVWIPPGTFVMGSPASEAERNSDETQHTVTLTKGFYMGKYLVTQADYLAVAGSNPSYFTGDLSRPVEQVSWYDATNYCGRLTQQEQAAGRLPAGWVYRLPTESEWEYACRAGTTTAFHYGNALWSGMANFYGLYEYDSSVGTIYNPSGIYLGRTTAVGSYQPNAWGLYDMHGNVWEWCRDWYGSYPAGSVTDPQGPGSGSYRVVRGGGWYGGARYCRSALRGFSFPSSRLYGVGFRVVLAPGQP
jgi:formylglycine-generating enzyme required for sulfatase activity